MFTRDHSISENYVLSLNYWKLWFFKRAQFLRGVFPQNWSMVTWFAGFGSFVLMCVCTKIWHVKGGCRSNKHHSYATIIVQVPPRLPPQLHNMCNSRIVIHTNRIRKQLVCLGRKLCSLYRVAEQCKYTTLTERFGEREIGWPEMSEWDAAHSGNPGQTIVSWHELCLHGS